MVSKKADRKMEPLQANVSKKEDEEEMEEDVEGNDEEEEEEDNEEENEEDEEEEEEAEVKPVKQTKARKPRSFLTGRGVTIAMLIEDGVMEPGEKLLSIDYLGQKFYADLLPDGRIKWPDADKQFNSPSAWAIHCKRMVNPSKKSGCGWASVKYKGRKLDQYKTTWFKKHRTGETHGISKTSPKLTSPTETLSSPKIEAPSSKPTVSPSTTPSLTSPTTDSNQRAVSSGTDKATPKPHSRGPGRPRLSSPSRSLKNPPGRPPGRPRLKSPGGTPQGIRKITSPSLTAQSLSLQASQSSSHVRPSSHSPVTSPLLRSPGPVLKSPLAGRKRSVRTRMSVKHSSVKPDSDPHTLVELVDFMATGKMQPFSIDISTNCLLLVDYHCHLTTSEITGYLAGKWDPQTHHMKILQAFPCRCRFADKENAPKVEEELRQALRKRGLQVVGWYHSHPNYQADPSVQDIKSQTKYQRIAQQALSGPHEPCIGMIVSPFDTYKPTKESTFRTFWVMQPSENNPDSLGVPMHVSFTVQQDQFLTEDLLNEMRWLWCFYKGSPDAIEFSNIWYGQQTYMDKVKASLFKKFPSDQADGRFVEFINTLLG
ncbi:MPN domain-containing protein-like isoform X2 [Actinia tenebrosa]|uniref:MPN domain-containing protein-like isoform X2 n=1 Tax=Actinia tenebrosa TaxID=6105 RepID=A0A6P8JB27_ACTTE|nr:MPN domain-containing protein-like isoform X2 [Actinia tenebrosa]